MKPIRDNEDFKGAFRNVQKGKKSQKEQNGQKVDFEGHGSLETLFQGYWRNSNCPGLFACEGN